MNIEIEKLRLENESEDVKHIKSLLGGCYTFITIKPDPCRYPADNEVFNEISTYMHNKGIKYWLRECLSPKNFLHIHGIISFPSSWNPKANKALQRYINRKNAFMRLDYLHNSADLESIIKYIKNPLKNKGVRETNSADSVVRAIL